MNLHMSIKEEDWICSCGQRRELVGPDDARKLRCRICEGYDGAFLTNEDREFLNDAGVTIQADGGPGTTKV